MRNLTLRRTLNVVLQLVIFIFLTIVSQVGGVVFLATVLIAKKFGLNLLWKKGSLFLLIYLLVTFLINPLLAPLFGREKIANTERLKPTSFITILLNRNYVVPELNEVIQRISNDKRLVDKGIELRYLDANFPFVNKFPLLPHLSHNDGRKIDLSLIYQTPEKRIVNAKKSISGYGVFEDPFDHEFDQTSFCKQEGYFQYDYPKYLTLGAINDELYFSEKGTKLVMECVLSSKEISKVFIERHLKERMNLKDARIRFQGCRAVRHDDHIHIQL